MKIKDMINFRNMTNFEDEDEMDIPEDMQKKAIDNLVEFFKKIFMIIYNKEDDSTIISNIIDIGIFDEDSCSIVFDSIRKLVESFSEIKEPNKKQEEFLNDEMTKLVNAIKIVYPEVIYNQFRIV